MRLLIVLLSLLLAGPAFADETSIDGRSLFLSRCAACHGTGAQGDGPMAAVIAIPVPDLTRLAARNGGEFPRFDVVRTIDGRMALRGHGGPMPVFGKILGGGGAVLDGPNGSVIETVGDIVAITAFLESIQVK